MEIIVGEATRALVKDYTYRELDVVWVRGKAEPVAIFEPVGLTEKVSQEEIKEISLHQETLKLYRTQQWGRAEMQFLNLQKMSDRLVYRIYIERIAEYRQTSPGDN